MRLKKALNHEDLDSIQTLLKEDSDVNIVLSNVFQDTPLFYAIKHGSLEVVELLLQAKKLDLDQKDRSNHTLLDEAICIWLTSGVTVTKEKQFSVGKRFRIIKCLLVRGAHSVTHTFLNVLIISHGNTTTGRQMLSKLVRLYCAKANFRAKDNLLSALMPHKFASEWIKQLLLHGANCSILVKAYILKASLPLANAIVLTKAANKPMLLQCIETDTCHGLLNAGSQWAAYKTLIHLLILAGHTLGPSSMRHLYCNHARTYVKLVRYESSPKPLKDLCRSTVRFSLGRNVFWGVNQLKEIPDPLRSLIALEEL